MCSTRRVIIAAAMALMGAATANAVEYDVKTLNMSPYGMFQLDPALLRVQPGDTVHFVAKDKGHNVLSIVGMIPDGAEPFKGETNKDIIVTLTEPGV